METDQLAGLIRYVLEQQARDQITSQSGGIPIDEGDLHELVVDMVERGCVVRSLEAVTGKKATISDYEARLGYIRRNLDSTLIDDIDNMPSFINELSASGSPLGIALSKLSVRKEEFSPEQIRGELMNGKKVICCIARQSDDKTTAHACCLDIDPRGGFVQISDKLGALSPSINLPPGEYHTFIFSRAN